MSRQNKAGAISALFIGLLLLVVLAANADVRVSAIARLQSATITPTPCDPDDQQDCDDYGTDTAIAYFDTQTALPSATRKTGTPTTSAAATTPTATWTPIPSPTTSSGVVSPAPSLVQPTPV